MIPRLIFPCLILALVSCTPPAREAHDASNNAVNENSEVASEWFLATGDWFNDPKLYIRTVGHGPDTVVILHGGFGGEHRSLVALANGLEDKYLFVLYDQRGSLRSPFPDSLITFDNHVNDLELIRKELGVNKLKIVGHSAGAILVAAYHDKYPERVKSLTLLAPASLKNPFPPEDRATADENSQKLGAFFGRSAVNEELMKLDLLRNNPPLSSLEQTYKFRISFASRFLYDVSKWRQLGAGGPFYNPKADQLTGQSMPSSGWDYFANFRKSGTPVSIIVGDHDFLDMGGRLNQKWSKDIPNVEVTVIENAAHQLWTDEPGKFRTSFDSALIK